jgi:NO-binding membrane sensor protein with MHYT domain
MIQAQLSSNFFTVLTWVAIISLTFGFCASWSLHFVGMLSCKLDLAVGLHVGLTVFSAVLAVSFTFAALGAELLWERYNAHKRRNAAKHRPNLPAAEGADRQEGDSSMPLLGDESTNGRISGDGHEGDGDIEFGRIDAPPQRSEIPSTDGPRDMSSYTPGSYERRRHAADPSFSTRLSSRGSGSHSDLRIGSSQLDLKSMADHGAAPTLNAFVATYRGILGGMSWKAVAMGLVWSLSLTCMHYGGVLAMTIPEGRMTFNPALVVASAIISWVVCIAGYIYIVNIEPHLSQQVLFSAIAASGIAAMHFTGLRVTNSSFFAHADVDQDCEQPHSGLDFHPLKAEGVILRSSPLPFAPSPSSLARWPMVSWRTMQQPRAINSPRLS